MSVFCSGGCLFQNFAIKAAIKNWERIRAGGISDVLRDSHTDARTDELPWITHIRTILQSHNMEHLYTSQNHKNKHPFIHKLIHKKQCQKFHLDAFQSISNPENKLRTYALFKTEVGCEKYLHEINNIATRQSLTKFRLSNNTLNIEKGRHTTPKTPKELRFCPFCPGEVEDEVHFLLGCPVYRVPRNEMIKTISKEKPLFSQGAGEKQLTELMASENAQFVAKTVQNLFEIREFLINEPKRPS